MLHKIEGLCAISGYPSELYDELYGDFHMTEGKEKIVNSSDEVRREVLWTNYDPITFQWLKGLPRQERA